MKKEKKNHKIIEPVFWNKFHQTRFSYFNECVQFQFYHFEPVIVEWLLHVFNHHHNILLQSKWQLLPIHIVHTIGHFFKASGRYLSKVAIKEQIRHYK